MLIDHIITISMYYLTTRDDGDGDDDDDDGDEGRRGYTLL